MKRSEISATKTAMEKIPTTMPKGSYVKLSLTVFLSIDVVPSLSISNRAVSTVTGSAFAATDDDKTTSKEGLQQVPHPAEAYHGFHVWALVWAGIGMLALAGAVVGIHALWAASHPGGAPVGDFVLSYVGFSIYPSLVLLTFWPLWKEARTEIHIRPIEGEHGAGRARERT